MISLLIELKPENIWYIYQECFNHDNKGNMEKNKKHDKSLYYNKWKLRSYIFKIFIMYSKKILLKRKKRNILNYFVRKEGK